MSDPEPAHRARDRFPLAIALRSRERYADGTVVSAWLMP